MPVLYQTFKSPIANNQGKKLFYPRVKLTGNVGTDVIAREIAQLSSLTTGDVKNVIDNLVTVMARHMQASESVTLDGFGTFRYTLKATKDGAENEADVTASLSQLMVRFLPASNRKTDGSLGTRSLVDGAKCVRFDYSAGSGSTSQPGGSTGGGSGEEEEGEGALG